MTQQLLSQAAPDLLVAGVTLLLSWFVGSWLAEEWAIRQKRKELKLQAAERFYQNYGQFFALWKLWNYAMAERKPESLRNWERQRQLLREEAARMEAGIEAMLLSVASEQVLSSREQQTMGNLRQAFQCLRECIHHGKPIPWESSDDPKYKEFKLLGCHMGSILSKGRIRFPSPAEARAAVEEITSNKYEKNWKICRQATG